MMQGFPALQFQAPDDTTNPVRWKRFKVLEIATGLMQASLQSSREQALAPQEAIELAVGLYDSAREKYSAAERQWEKRMVDLEKKRQERLKILEEERAKLDKSLRDQHQQAFASQAYAGFSNANNACAVDQTFDEAEKKLLDETNDEAKT